MDATLKEISGLVKEVNPDARRHGTVFDFSLVYPDKFRGYRAAYQSININKWLVV